MFRRGYFSKRDTSYEPMFTDIHTSGRCVHLTTGWDGARRPIEAKLVFSSPEKAHACATQLVMMYWEVPND